VTKPRVAVALATGISVLLCSCDESKETHGITVSPSAMGDCEANKIVTVSWDATKKPNVVPPLDIYVSDDGRVEKLFVQGGLSGQEVTGPWAKANITFILKEKATNKELARAAIAATPCK
jgi:hypothetical protein